MSGVRHESHLGKELRAVGGSNDCHGGKEPNIWPLAVFVLCYSTPTNLRALVCTELATGLLGAAQMRNNHRRYKIQLKML